MEKRGRGRPRTSPVGETRSRLGIVFLEIGEERKAKLKQLIGRQMAEGASGVTLTSVVCGLIDTKLDEFSRESVQALKTGKPLKAVKPVRVAASEEQGPPLKAVKAVKASKPIGVPKPKDTKKTARKAKTAGAAA